jgi:formylglycine-generating enzyme required for sulfatase activity
MADSRVYRNAVKSLSLFDAKVLRRVARKCKVKLPKDDLPSSRLAEHLVEGLYHATHFFDHLTPQEQDAVGKLLGVGSKKQWRPKISAEKLASLPFYARPSWENDVVKALCRKTSIRRSAIRRSSGQAIPTNNWPKLTKKVTTELAVKLGNAFEARGPGRIWYHEAQVMLVAVPAGKFKMGLQPSEWRVLEKRATRLCVEAVEHAKEIAIQSCPVRIVKIESFLLAETAILRGTALEAAREIRRLGARLPSESEWEYVARGEGRKSWVNDRTNRWGVLDLDWSDWVDDSWHPNYRGAPTDGSAWEPRNRPEIARGGLMELWPWQSGEEIQLHVAARIHNPKGDHGIRPAWSFPPR